uniref:Uncharacterized protein n=1 Tax=Pseudomonas phage HRDY3 TaxID=3236930 RepID=A0AB39CED6_9VIRU
MYVNEIQWELAQHAARYQTDIGVLTQAEKIKHFALVVGRISSDYQLEELLTFSRHGFDLFYNIMMFANYMNMDMLARNRSSMDYSGCETMEDYVEAYLPEVNLMEIRIDLIIQMGTFCKIAEATDHMEPMNFRAEVTKVVDALYHIAWRMIASEGDGQEQNISKNFEAYMVRKEKKMHQCSYKGHFSLDAACYMPL